MSHSRKLTLVALRMIKYSDRHSILAAYSREAGRLSFLVPSGNTREATRRRALLMPLSLVECKTDLVPGRDIHTMRDVAPLIPLHGIHSHPVKASIAMFMAEVLGLVLRESQGDDAMFAFLKDSILVLDRLPSSRVANFHIVFLLKLLRFTGIEPDYHSARDGYLFDLVDGVYRASAPLHPRYLSPVETRFLTLLSRIGYHTMHRLQLTREQRNLVTDRLLEYYSLHLAKLSSLTTLPVLRAL